MSAQLSALHFVFMLKISYANIVRMDKENESFENNNNNK
jgi:hypothetical protein